MEIDRTARLIAARKKELAQLPSLAQVIRGTLIRYRLTCGNRRCQCHGSKNARHGPYWYVSISYGKGRQKRYLLNPKQTREAKEGIAVYRKLWQSICRISEINLTLLKNQR